MNHNMNLNPDAFQKVKSGEKVREYRLYDEKRRKIKIGDTITFRNLSKTNELVTVEVTDLITYPDWRICYADFFEEDLRGYYDNIDEAVSDTYENWWSKEKEEKYGCLVIVIKKLD